MPVVATQTDPDITSSLTLHQQVLLERLETKWFKTMTALTPLQILRKELKLTTDEQIKKDEEEHDKIFPFEAKERKRLPEYHASVKELEEWALTGEFRNKKYRTLKDLRKDYKL